MNPNAKPQLRVIDNQHEHNLDWARRKVKEFMLDREKGEKPLPVSNVHDDKGARVLDVDQVVNSSLPNHARK